jgi:hypothetical protein
MQYVWVENRLSFYRKTFCSGVYGLILPRSGTGAGSPPKFRDKFEIPPEEQ